MPSSKTRDSKKSQSQRFIEAAREAECSEDEAVFDQALRRIEGKALKPSKPSEGDER